MSSQQISVTDDLELLLEVLPEPLRRTLARHHRDDLVEVVLDLGRQPEARYPDDCVVLAEEPVTRDDLVHVVERVGRFGKDNRAGIERTLHRISALRNRTGGVVGLTCRVGRAVFGTVDIVTDVIRAGQSTLLLGRPGVGKTTLLREAARVLADDLGQRVVVVDTSNEIAGDGDIPHPGIGRARRMQVPSPDAQHGVMIEAVENHMPEVVVIDEIGTEAEAHAARTIAERGVQLIATAHGNTLENLLQNPTLSDLVGGIHVVTLSDEEARRRGTQKTVLERKAPPTFDVVIEIQRQDRLAVHHGVAEVVDRFLRGVPPSPEIRVRLAGGEVEIREPEPPRTATAEERAPAAPPPWARATPPTGGPRRRRLRRILPYAVNRSRLERAIRRVHAPVRLVGELREADMILTTKGQERRLPRRLRDAQDTGLPVHLVRSNTLTQMENFLRTTFNLPGELDEPGQALREAEEAVEEALREGHPVELPARASYLRRLQHELVEQLGLASESTGDEPYRRLVVYPA